MSKSRFKSRSVLNEIYETASFYKTYILIVYWLNSDTRTYVSGGIWDEIRYTGHAHMPRKYHTGPGGHPNPSDAGSERQHDIPRYIGICSYTQAAESDVCTFFLLFDFI